MQHCGVQGPLSLLGYMPFKQPWSVARHTCFEIQDTLKSYSAMLNMYSNKNVYYIHSDCFTRCRQVILLCLMLACDQWRHNITRLVKRSCNNTNNCKCEFYIFPVNEMRPFSVSFNFNLAVRYRPTPILCHNVESKSSYYKAVIGTSGRLENPLM